MAERAPAPWFVPTMELIGALPKVGRVRLVRGVGIAPEPDKTIPKRSISQKRALRRWYYGPTGKKWREDNKEYHKAYKAAWYQKNKAKVLAAKKKRLAAKRKKDSG